MAVDGQVSALFFLDNSETGAWDVCDPSSQFDHSLLDVSHPSPNSDTRGTMFVTSSKFCLSAIDVCDPSP